MRLTGNGVEAGMESPLALAARLGEEACAGLELGYRSQNGQFPTPPDLARLLAGMFPSTYGDVRLLDAGAGAGNLTAAFVEYALGRERKPRSLHLVAWETEGAFVNRLERVLEECVAAGRAQGVPTSFELKHGDLLEDGAELLDVGDLFSTRRRSEEFTHTVMNPPYRKINTDSRARLLLRRAGLETSNLYSGFLWLAARLLGDGGWMVAITPRSFCNGPYFRPFRERFFGEMALERLHVFDRRDTLFAGDEVLQENLIMVARRNRAKRSTVILSSSDGTQLGATRSRTVPYSRVIDPNDISQVVHLALEHADDEAKRLVMGMPESLEGLGIEVSTGRVVDFRARDFLRSSPGTDTVPLIYPAHFQAGCVRWPSADSRKANALLAAPETEDLMVPSGVYVVVKRFTAKEERRRVVASVFRPEGDLAPYSSVGFENHLNYFHRRGRPLDEKVASGLAVYLNSTAVDSYFRQFSGHTQVNATDLRSLRYPSKEQLCALARSTQTRTADQGAIDAALDAMNRTPRR